jgi:hypothetical protein
MSPGEKRRRQRKRAKKQAAYAARIADLRAGGASCGNCQHLRKTPAGMKGHCCDLDSDAWTGYLVVTEADICDKHTKVQP